MLLLVPALVTMLTPGQCSGPSDRVLEDTRDSVPFVRVPKEGSETFLEGLLKTPVLVMYWNLVVLLFREMGRGLPGGGGLLPREEVSVVTGQGAPGGLGGA